MTLVDKKYKELCDTPLDCNEHLPVLRYYADQCLHVTELGVRKGVSTWAFLSSKTKRLISVDNVHPGSYGGELTEMIDAAKEVGIEFNFILADDLTIKIEDTELLFIDTFHVYRQLKEELLLHANKVKKYIILHDTETYGLYGEDGGEGLLKALDEFLENNIWKIKEVFKNNNGLIILERYEN